MEKIDARKKFHNGKNLSKLESKIKTIFLYEMSSLIFKRLPKTSNIKNFVFLSKSI